MKRIKQLLAIAIILTMLFCPSAAVYAEEPEMIFHLSYAGASIGLPDKMNNLGYCYEKGIGTDVDLEAAIKWYTKAADDGDGFALNNLARCYSSGVGVEKDMTRALELYQRAADAGCAAAMNNLGMLYYWGKDAERDWKKAVELFSASANKGDAAGMNNLAACYKYGKGVDPDSALAESWYAKAKQSAEPAAELTAPGEMIRGVVHDPQTDTWLFIRDDFPDESFTGVALHIETDTWYYIENGVVDWNTTAVKYRPADDQWVYVENGKMNPDYTGVIFQPNSDEGLYIADGRVGWSMTGVQFCPERNQWLYVEGGRVNFEKTGLVFQAGTDEGLYVENGVFTETYNGTYTDESGTVYTFVNSRIKPADKQEPTIVLQPKDVSAEDGSYAVFKVEAEGDNVNYQWQYCAPGSDSWNNSPLSGSDTNELVVPATLDRNGFQYRCIVSNSLKTVYSDAATFTVVTPVSKPTITAQPKNATVDDGKTATFTVKANGENLSYQWQYRKSNSSSWSSSSMSGNKTAKLTITASQKYNGYQFRCKVTNSAGTVYSNAATLTVNAPKTSTTAKTSTALPKTGELVRTIQYQGGNELHLKAVSGNVELTAVDISSKQYVRVFVRKGETFTVFLPAGDYDLSLKIGDVWYGDEIGFGSDCQDYPHIQTLNIKYTSEGGWVTYYTYDWVI